MRVAMLLGVLLVALSIVPVDARAGIALTISSPSQAPPPVRTEKHGDAPYKNAIWIDGHWAWSNGQYVWQGGHWQRVREGSRGWQQGVWSRKDGSWYWTPGKWL